MPYIGVCASWAEGTYNEQQCISKLWYVQKYFIHLLYFICTFVFQSAAVPSRRNTNSQPAQSPVRCKQYHFKTQNSFRFERFYYATWDDLSESPLLLEKHFLSFVVLLSCSFFIIISSGILLKSIQLD